MSASARIYYPTDLTDSQWELIEPLLPEVNSGLGRGGRPTRDRREIRNAILYVVKTGCQWRWMPSEFGPWQTVYGYFNAWSQTTVWQGILEELNMKERCRQGRHPEPTVGCIVSQKTFAAIDRAIFDSLWRWAVRVHPNKGKRWIKPFANLLLQPRLQRREDRTALRLMIRQTLRAAHRLRFGHGLVREHHL